MLQDTRTYTNFDGKEIKKTFYFNLTEAEITEMEATTAGGMAERLQRIIDGKDGREIMDTFTGIIKAAYGVKSDDGEYFVKTEEAWLQFKSTKAYSDLFMELCTDSQKAADFMKGIIPTDINIDVDEIYKQETVAPVDIRPVN